MITFTQWLEAYWGYSFLDEPELTNGPGYRERGVNSKYKGPGKKQKSNLSAIDKMYGFSPESKFHMGNGTFDYNKMKKKMKKSK